MTAPSTYAVMAQRKGAHDSLDHFPTPPWATRALCEHVLKPIMGGSCFITQATAWEPACGDGAMARPLAEYFASVRASDVHNYGFGEVDDFLMPAPVPADQRPDWIVTNPPFRLAEDFIRRAIPLAKHGVAMLVRLQFVEGVGRWKMFCDRPPAVVAPFAERVAMVKGRLDPKASTATAYCWIVWMHGHASMTSIIWIPPCRKALERGGDWG